MLLWKNFGETKSQNVFIIYPVKHLRLNKTKQTKQKQQQKEDRQNQTTLKYMTTARE